VELIAISMVTIRSIWHKVCTGLFSFGKFLPHICESRCTIYRHSYESFSALQSKSIPLTDAENCVQIDP